MAEKALKAWLAILGADFPRTHDLSLLIHKLGQEGAEVTSLWAILDLNPFAVQFRYEILDDEPLDHEATLAQVTALLNHVESLRTPERNPGDSVGES